MPRQRIYASNAERQAAYRKRRKASATTTTASAATKKIEKVAGQSAAFDRGDALLWLHAQQFSETTLRVGMQHLAVADIRGEHCESRATLAEGCGWDGEAGRIRVKRENDELEAAGFMKKQRRQLTNGSRAYTTSKYVIQVGRR